MNILKLGLGYLRVVVVEPSRTIFGLLAVDVGHVMTFLHCGTKVGHDRRQLVKDFVTVTSCNLGTCCNKNSIKLSGSFEKKIEICK